MPFSRAILFETKRPKTLKNSQKLSIQYISIFPNYNETILETSSWYYETAF